MRTHSLTNLVDYVTDRREEESQPMPRTLLLRADGAAPEGLVGRPGVASAMVGYRTRIAERGV